MKLKEPIATLHPKEVHLSHEDKKRRKRKKPAVKMPSPTKEGKDGKFYASGSN